MMTCYTYTSSSSRSSASSSQYAAIRLLGKTYMVLFTVVILFLSGLFQVVSFKSFNAGLVDRLASIDKKSFYRPRPGPLSAIGNSDSEKGHRGQTYGVPTYDALFKWILDDEEIRPSFFNAFVPDIHVKSSTRLDESMNPLKEYQLLRQFINNNKTSLTVKNLQNMTEIEVRGKLTPKGKFSPSKKGTAFLQELLSFFGDIIQGFPLESYDGTMDFVCLLDSGDYALVETQVIPQDYWDRRALAYIAAFYGNQIRKGGKWKAIKKVIGINILGPRKPWKDAPDESMRHYRFQEQINPGPRFIDGIELYQYSTANAPINASTIEQREWLRFLREAHKMTEADVEAIQTPAVRRAFERAKLTKLNQSQLKAYEMEDISLSRSEEYIKSERSDGFADGVRSVALSLLVAGKEDKEICSLCGLSMDQLISLKKQISK